MHSKMRDSDFVAARYRRSLQSLCQSSVVGVSTLFVRKENNKGARLFSFCDDTEERCEDVWTCSVANERILASVE